MLRLHLEQGHHKAPPLVCLRLMTPVLCQAAVQLVLKASQSTYRYLVININTPPGLRSVDGITEPFLFGELLSGADAVNHGLIN